MDRHFLRKKITLKNCFYVLPFIFILFQCFCLDKLIRISNRSIFNYRCSRINEEFNISLVKNKDNQVFVYDKYKKIFQFDFKDLEDIPNSFKGLLVNAFDTKRAFNIRTHGKYVLIYTEKSVADEVYTLEDGDTLEGGDENIIKFKNLMKARISKRHPVSLRMLETLLYLFCKGYLDNHTILVYRKSIMLYSENGSFVHFDVDLKPFLGVDLQEGRNSFLAFVVIINSHLGLVTNKFKDMKYFSMTAFIDKLKEFLACAKNKEILEFVRKEQYLEIEGMVDKKDIDQIYKVLKENKMKSEFKKLLILEE